MLIRFMIPLVLLTAFSSHAVENLRRRFEARKSVQENSYNQALPLKWKAKEIAYALNCIAEASPARVLSYEMYSEEDAADDGTPLMIPVMYAAMSDQSICRSDAYGVYNYGVYCSAICH